MFVWQNRFFRCTVPAVLLLLCLFPPWKGREWHHSYSGFRYESHYDQYEQPLGHAFVEHGPPFPGIATVDYGRLAVECTAAITFLLLISWVPLPRLNLQSAVGLVRSRRVRTFGIIALATVVILAALYAIRRNTHNAFDNAAERGYGIPRQEPAAKETSSKNDRVEDDRWEAVSPGNFVELGTRPVTGANGTLKIENGTEHDALVRLAEKSSGATRRMAFIRSGQSGELESIQECICILQFSLGSDLDEERRVFRKPTSYAQFQDSFDFSEHAAPEGGIKYRTYSVTLQPVFDGKARVEPINETDFGR